MKGKGRTISIRKLPPKLNSAHQQSFYRELESCINVDRPSLVLDCSMLVRLDRSAIHLLLCCLEEAMKRNGDVRLAALQPELQSIFKSTGLDTIFQAFDDINDAVESFRASRNSVVRREVHAAVEISASSEIPAQVSAA